MYGMDCWSLEETSRFVWMILGLAPKWGVRYKGYEMDED